MSGFVPLRVRSHGSLLFGTASPEALVRRALELGATTLALTDRDNLYLAVRFYQAARAEGLRPLLGCTLGSGRGEVLLLPLDRRGYANMCRLITRRHLDPDFDLVTALADREESGCSTAGLHVIVESSGLAASLLAAGVPPARAVRDARIGSGSWGIEATRSRAPHHAAGLWMGFRGLTNERARLPERATAARRLGLPLVATGDCVLLSPADFETHRTAVTAAAGELIDRMPRSAFCDREACLMAPAAWERRVRALCAGAGIPTVADEALLNNRALADRCRLELELGTPIFPRAPLPAGETGAGYLRRLCEAGLSRRYHTHARRAHARLDEELSMIERMGFTDYFLLVAEIVEFARARRIPTVGRGSGASSIVAYGLGITNVDPLRYGLTFERFLNPARRDCPDLDIDLCWRRRDEVIAHVYETYGHDRVAMISTHATLGARSAFRETAKALGVSNHRMNALARRVPRELEKPYLDRLEKLPEARAVDWREPVLSQALALAERLCGAPRHLSIHCGGIVIGDRRLTDYVPLERSAKNVVVTQFEMRAIEAIGLVKMDLLGNRALSTIGECIELVRRRCIECRCEDGGDGADPRDAREKGTERVEKGEAEPWTAEPKRINPWPLPAPALRGGVRPAGLDRVPDFDRETAARVASGDTLNCFQLESPAMRHLLRMLDARTLDDTIAAVALVRPGPAESGRKEAFCRRRRGLERPTFREPRLEPVLAATYGVMLYEEDVMRVAVALTGLSLAEGDDLRRAIGAARSDEEFRSLERGFVTRAVAAGCEAEAAGDVWRDLTRFASYAFCKAHAAGYGVLGYHSAYLKTHFPVEYAVAILNHHAGMYATWVHVEDLRRHGVTFLPPCVHRSDWDTTMDEGAVRVGLGRVYGLAEATGQRTVAARSERRFRSLADFIDRVRPTLPETETLILAGALDGTGRSRPSLLLEARASARSRSNGARVPAEVLMRPDGVPLEPEPVAPVAVPELPEFDRAERVRAELRATGLWFSGHPLDGISPRALADATPAALLPDRVGQQAAVVGLPCAYRRVETKRGGDMLFVTLADRSGLAECVLFPDTYRAQGDAVRGDVVRIQGRIDDTLGAVTLVAQGARSIPGEL